MPGKRGKGEPRGKGAGKGGEGDDAAQVEAVEEVSEEQRRAEAAGTAVPRVSSAVAAAVDDHVARHLRRKRDALHSAARSAANAVFNAAAVAVVTPDPSPAVLRATQAEPPLLPAPIDSHAAGSLPTRGPGQVSPSVVPVEEVAFFQQYHPLSRRSRGTPLLATRRTAVRSRHASREGRPIDIGVESTVHAIEVEASVDPGDATPPPAEHPTFESHAAAAAVAAEREQRRRGRRLLRDHRRHMATMSQVGRFRPGPFDEEGRLRTPERDHVPPPPRGAEVDSLSQASTAAEGEEGRPLSSVLGASPPPRPPVVEDHAMAARRRRLAVALGPARDALAAQEAARARRREEAAREAERRGEAMRKAFRLGEGEPLPALASPPPPGRVARLATEEDGTVTAVVPPHAGQLSRSGALVLGERGVLPRVEEEEEEEEAEAKGKKWGRRRPAKAEDAKGATAPGPPSAQEDQGAVRARLLARSRGDVRLGATEAGRRPPRTDHGPGSGPPSGTGASRAPRRRYADGTVFLPGTQPPMEGRVHLSPGVSLAEPWAASFPSSHYSLPERARRRVQEGQGAGAGEGTQGSVTDGSGGSAPLRMTRQEFEHRFSAGGAVPVSASQPRAAGGDASQSAPQGDVKEQVQEEQEGQEGAGASVPSATVGDGAITAAERPSRAGSSRRRRSRRRGGRSGRNRRLGRGRPTTPLLKQARPGAGRVQRCGDLEAAKGREEEVGEGAASASGGAPPPLLPPISPLRRHASRPRVVVPARRSVLHSEERERHEALLRSDNWGAAEQGRGAARALPHVAPPRPLAEQPSSGDYEGWTRTQSRAVARHSRTGASRGGLGTSTSLPSLGATPSEAGAASTGAGRRVGPRSCASLLSRSTKALGTDGFLHGAAEAERRAYLASHGARRRRAGERLSLLGGQLADPALSTARRRARVAAREPAAAAAGAGIAWG